MVSTYSKDEVWFTTPKDCPCVNFSGVTSPAVVLPLKHSSFEFFNKVTYLPL